MADIHDRSDIHDTSDRSDGTTNKTASDITTDTHTHTHTHTTRTTRTTTNPDAVRIPRDWLGVGGRWLLRVERTATSVGSVSSGDTPTAPDSTPDTPTDTPRRRTEIRELALFRVAENGEMVEGEEVDEDEDDHDNDRGHTTGHPSHPTHPSHQHPSHPSPRTSPSHRYYAIDAVCPHSGGPLHLADVEEWSGGCWVGGWVAGYLIHTLTEY